MTEQDTLLYILHDIARLRQEVQRLKSSLPLYTIINQKRVTLSLDQTAWDIPNVDHILVEPTLAINIHGIANGVDGRVLFIHNQTGNNVTLKYFSASATLTNRIAFATAADVVLGGGDVAMLVYCYFVGQSNYLWRGFFVSP